MGLCWGHYLSFLDLVGPLYLLYGEQETVCGGLDLHHMGTRDPEIDLGFVYQASASGRDRIVFDSQQPGLGLRITPIGTKIFIAEARVSGASAASPSATRQI